MSGTTGSERDAVLVVDDEPAGLRAMQRALRAEYEVLAAGSGVDALGVLEQRAVALVVADHRMPGMSGVELLARVARLHPAVVRVVLTGYTDIDSLLQAINEGQVFYYLTKPWEPRELRLVVRRGVERYRAERERRRLLSELEAACEQARREAERWQRMLGAAAHELGTPLHIARNALDFLSVLPEVRASTWLAPIERALQWLQRVLAELRAGASVLQGRVVLRRGAVNLGVHLAAIVQALQCAAASRRLAFDLACPAELRIHGDPEWLDQLWISLLSNAVRFTPDGGRIAVCGRRVGARAEVEVADTGIGMSPGQIASAFEPFTPAAGDLLLHSSGRFDFGARGLGLGLFVAREIALAHGGTIAVESPQGGGTRVTVRLPLLAETA